MKTSIVVTIAIAILALVAGTALAESPFTADRASNLISAKAIDTDGKTLGTIKDLVIGADDQISYLVIQKSDMSGFVAVPFDAAAPRVNPDGDVVLALDKESFDKAPTFASSNWPDLSRPMPEGARGYRSNPMDSDATLVNGIYTVNPYPF